MTTERQKLLLDLLNGRWPENPPSHIDIGTRKYLQRYADAWIKAQYRLQQWDLKRDCENVRRRRTTPMLEQDDGPVFVTTAPVRLKGVPEDEEALMAEIYDEQGHADAASLFLDLITCEFYDKLARCARLECRNFYINTSGHANKIYCSNTCARIDTAERATRERRKREEELKLEAIHAAFTTLRNLPATQRKKVFSTGWKHWIAERAGMEITPNYITGAINRGLLTLPKWMTQGRRARKS
jgi:hypothetical protein